MNGENLQEQLDQAIKSWLRTQPLADAARGLDPTCLTHGDFCAAMIAPDDDCDCGLDAFRRALEEYNGG